MEAKAQKKAVGGGDTTDGETFDQKLRAHRKRIHDHEIKTEEEIEKQVVPGKIVQMSGRPIRLTITGTLGGVRATMVEPGYFPPSATGFYSITHFGLAVWKGNIGRAEVLEVIEEEGLSSFLEEREEYSRDEGRGRSGLRKASALVGSGPSAWANEILTRPVSRRDEIIQDGLELVSKGVQIAQNEVLPAAKYENSRVSEGQVRGTIDSGQKTLQMLEKADRTSLFGEGDLGPAIERASSNVRKAYGQWDFGRYISEKNIRARLRQKLGVKVLKSRHMADLREKMLIAFGE